MLQVSTLQFRTQLNRATTGLRCQDTSDLSTNLFQDVLQAYSLGRVTTAPAVRDKETKPTKQKTHPSSYAGNQ